MLLKSIFSILFLSLYWCIPSLHKVNDVNLQGEQCPLATLFNQECPYLCVRDIKECPSSLSLECKSNEQLCGDGLCHAKCEGILNVCACGNNESNYVPCPLTARANINNLIPENRTSLIEQGCTKVLNLNEEEVESWNLESTKKYLWLNCPLVEAPQFTFLEVQFIVFYVIATFSLILFSSWFLYKNIKEASFKVIDTKEFNEKIKDDITLNSLNEQFQPYKSNWFGNVVYYYLNLLVVILLISLAIMVADNYGAINQTYYYIFLSSDLVSKCFVFMWYITSAVLIIMNAYKPVLRDWFRLKCSPKQAQYIQISKLPDAVILMNNENIWIHKFKTIQNKVLERLRLNYEYFNAKVETTNNNKKYFNHRSLRYILDDSSELFLPYHIELPTNSEQLLNLSNGLTNEQVNLRQQLIGPNTIEVKVANFFEALLNEFSSFFYLYQMMCLWIWYFFIYYQMGLVQTFVIIISALIRVYLKIKSETKIKNLAQQVYTCKVKRNNEWIEISSIDLVPGDIILFESVSKVLADCLLLNGELMVDESMITGEAMPMRKLAIKKDTTNPILNSNHTLSSGTDILQINQSNNEPVIGLVLATGIHTSKGKLMQKILFPNNYAFVFQDHLKLVILILLTWGAICFGLSIYLMGRGDINSWFYGMFVISQIMSPLLPSALVAGQSIAASRLRKQHDINCVDLPRIMLAGKLSIFCFDKTGTLTKEGLDLFGLKPNNKELNGFDIVIRYEDASFYNIDRKLQLGLAACHSVSKLKDKNIGNPVDVEMFESSGWQFSNNYDKNQYINQFEPIKFQGKPINIIKCNEFVHSKASMSVILEDLETGKWFVYVKGSFEKIKLISNKDTIPNDYDTATNQLAREGCYVLGLAYKELGILDDEQKQKIIQMDIEELEFNSQFLSLIMFKNQLKSDTLEAIKELKQGNIKPIMITGDNAFTAVYIGRQCEMIQANTQVLIGNLNNSNNIEFMDVDNDNLYDLKQVKQLIKTSINSIELAISNKAFDYLIANDDINSLLPYIRIFARMTPQGKVSCIELQMQLGIVGMCGDGGNDCGALRAAHVGIALSDAEASIVSPFSAKDRKVTSCVTLIKYGRAALSSSFSSYKFLILYGEIMAWLELTQFYFSVVVTQPIWITIDGFVTTLMLICITLAKPADQLASTRPTAKLLGPQTLISAISQSLVNLLTLIIAIYVLFQQSFYKCNEFDGASVDTAKWWLMGDNYEASIIGLICLFQFINAGAIFNFGHLYRASWYKNYTLVFIYFAMLAFASFLVLADPNQLSCIFRVNCGSAKALTDILNYPLPTFEIQDYNNPIGHNVFPAYFRYTLFGIIIANTVINYIVEYFIVLKGFTKFGWTKSIKSEKS